MNAPHAPATAPECRVSPILSDLWYDWYGELAAVLYGTDKGMPSHGVVLRDLRALMAAVRGVDEQARTLKRGFMLPVEMKRAHDRLRSILATLDDDEP